MWRHLLYSPQINFGLRQTLILCLPITVFFLLGRLDLGLVFALVPACCNIAGLDTHHRHFIKRIIVGAILFSLSSFLMVFSQVRLHIPLPIVLLALAMLFGVTQAISPLHARLLPASIVAAIFSLSFLNDSPIWFGPLIFTLGTLWYGFFTFIWYRLWREQPINEQLSLLYRQLADYFELKYSLFTKISHKKENNSLDEILPELLQKQQSVMDTVNLVYQQLNMMSNLQKPSRIALVRSFQTALDLQEHMMVTLHQPEEIQNLIAQSQAWNIIRKNVSLIVKRVRIIADDILYHRHSGSFSMDNELYALQKLARRYPDNPVGNFCAYHFQRIAYLITYQLPLYAHVLIPDKPHISFWRALVNYLSISSQSMRVAARIGITLAVGAALGELLELPKLSWMLLTIMLVSQNGYNATRIRIQHRALGTLIGLVIATFILMLPLPQSCFLVLMLAITLFSYIQVRTNYVIAVIGFTITAVYVLHFIANDTSNYAIARLLDTILGGALVWAGTILLWPQWQSGLIRTNANQVLESELVHLRLLLVSPSDELTQEYIDKLSHSCMLLNKAQNTLYTSLTQAMQEPGFNSLYLSDLRLWVTHNQMIVEHINGITALIQDNNKLAPDLSLHYLQECEIAIQRCQQRLEKASVESHDAMEHIQPLQETPSSIVEHHLSRILFHLRAMNNISSIIWRQQQKGSQINIK